jgi:F-type H+-transporting ATPase subunit b
LLKEAREMKDKIIADAKDTAQVEADKMIKQAKIAIESERQAAVAELKNQVASLSVDIAEKVLRAELSDKKKQLKMVEEQLGDVTLN